MSRIIPSWAGLPDKPSIGDLAGVLPLDKLPAHSHTWNDLAGLLPLDKLPAHTHDDRYARLSGGNTLSGDQVVTGNITASGGITTGGNLVVPSVFLIGSQSSPGVLRNGIRHSANDWVDVVAFGNNRARFRHASTLQLAPNFIDWMSSTDFGAATVLGSIGPNSTVIESRSAGGLKVCSPDGLALGPVAASQVAVGGGWAGNMAIQINGAANGFYATSGSTIRASCGGSVHHGWGAGFYEVQGAIGLCTTSPASGLSDIWLNRQSANTAGIGTTTTNALGNLALGNLVASGLVSGAGLEVRGANYYRFDTNGTDGRIRNISSGATNLTFDGSGNVTTGGKLTLGSTGWLPFVFEQFTDPNNGTTSAMCMYSTTNNRRIYFGKPGTSNSVLNFSAVSSIESLPSLNTSDGVTFGGITSSHGVGRSVDALVISASSTAAGADIIFRANNAGYGTHLERMRIAGATGNLLIGTTTDDGSSRLQVSGAVRSRPRSATVAPNVTDIPSGFSVWWQDTVLGTRRYAYNDGGVIFQSPLLKSSIPATPSDLAGVISVLQHWGLCS